MLTTARGSGSAAAGPRALTRMALDILLILMPLGIFLGDQHGLNRLADPPAEVAAIGARHETEAPDAVSLFGISHDAAESLLTRSGFRILADRS